MASQRCQHHNVPTAGNQSSPPAAIAGNRGLREDGGDCGDEAGIFRGGGLRGEDMEERGHQWLLQGVSGSVDRDTIISRS